MFLLNLICKEEIKYRVIVITICSRALFFHICSETQVIRDNDTKFKIYHELYGGLCNRCAQIGFYKFAKL